MATKTPVATKKPVITLKNIKFFADGSQETYCYTATIYVDGKRFATVENGGHGGPDNVHVLNMNGLAGHKAFKDLNQLIAQTYPAIDFEDTSYADMAIVGTMEQTLEGLCHNLVGEFLLKRDFKKVMRRISYVKNDKRGVWQLAAKHKPDADTMTRVRELDWAKNVTFLMDLPQDKALELFKANT